MAEQFKLKQREQLDVERVDDTVLSIKYVKEMVKMP